MSQIISNNSDFLFLYEAIQCNPNGDPDQENRPRMDYDTHTNLVTDTRIKRYIRDFLKITGHKIFVDMEGESKVSPESKLEAVIKQILADGDKAKNLFAEQPEMQKRFEAIVKEKKTPEAIFKSFNDKGSKNKDVSIYLLQQIVKQDLIDIRMFGSAFAVAGFNKSYTGAIQMNWGYSLHKVEQMESNSIVTIMNDDSSTFGKDYRVHYSLLAFNGTINKYTAQSTGLTDADVSVFRDAIWKAIPALPTRSKMNQYPKLYVEVVYNEGFQNGQFGDLRQLIEVKVDAQADQHIRKYEDISLDFSKLIQTLNENTGEGKAIKEVIIQKAHNVHFSL